MSRRIASQVHKQASRLLRQNYLRTEPAWFQAVLSNPPLPLPPKQPSPRTSYDLSPSGASTTHSLKNATKVAGHPEIQPVEYLEDKLRRQFFQDHPFEAFRPASLLEGGRVRDEHPIRGKQWTRLRQRGRNPTPEDAIRYAINLHEYHDLPLTNAYAAAVAQFRSLRAEHRIASSVALLEAEAYGWEFGSSQVEISFEKEEKALDTWQKKAEFDAGAFAARKRWKAEIDRKVGSWTRGQEYVRLWKEGVRPNYSPALTESGGLSTADGRNKRGSSKATKRAAQNVDYLALAVQRQTTPSS
ncbi:hypothetical protein K474DRAFT_1682731 [Panus rudis PR-1116 ss-1]|nr:hypothetical protein K474DRAFT_1682731 [Panus rudis PR-1116 ss-1]